MPEPATHDGNGITLGQPGKTHKDASGNYCDSACVAKIYYQQWVNAKHIAEMAARQSLVQGYQLPYSAAMLAIPEWSLPDDCDKACQARLFTLQAKYLNRGSGGKDFDGGPFTCEGGHGCGMFEKLSEKLLGQKTQANVAGGGYLVFASVLGKDVDCSKHQGLTMCKTSSSWIFGRGGTTIGNTYVTGYDPDFSTKKRLRHERVHMEQWDDLGLRMAWDYFQEGIEPCTNSFEIEAGLGDGDYLPCP